MVLKAGVIGCGRMGAEKSERLKEKIASGWLPISHTESLQLCESIEKVLLCESDHNRIKYLEDNYPDCEIYTKLDDLLAHQPDILTVATRTPTKKEIIKKALEYNVKGLYIEKPFANNIADCEALLKLAQEKNVFVSYGVNRRFHAAYRKIKQEIENGVIGKLTHIVADFGPGGLFWTHPHSMDLLLYFGGKPLNIRAELDNVEHDENGDVQNDPPLINAEVKFENGIVGTVSNIPGYTLKLVGEKGIIVIHADATFIEKYFLCQVTGNFTNHTIEYPLQGDSATVTAFKELCSTVLSQESESFRATISESDILTGLKMIFGCVDSHLSGGKIIDISSIKSEYSIYAINYGNPA